MKSYYQDKPNLYEYRIIRTKESEYYLSQRRIKGDKLWEIIAHNKRLDWAHISIENDKKHEDFEIVWSEQ